MDGTPLVSVIIPTYNRAIDVRAAISSAQNQSLSEIEIVVVDDASSDNTCAVVDQLRKADSRIRLLALDANSGPSRARNDGVNAARGMYVSFLDSDDRWHPDKLQGQLGAVSELEDPSRAFCVTHTRVVYGDGRNDEILPRRPVGEGERWAHFLFTDGNFAQCSSFFLSKVLADELAFDETLRQYEDHDYFLSAGEAGAEYVLVERTLVEWFNDERDGRLGRSDDMQRGGAFLDRVGDRLTTSESLAFQLRYLGPTIATSSRRRGIALAIEGLRARGVPVSLSLKLLVASLLGQRVYERVRARVQVSAFMARRT